jgi:hypothetical protein
MKEELIKESYETALPPKSEFIGANKIKELTNYPLSHRSCLAKIMISIIN